MDEKKQGGPDGADPSSSEVAWHVPPPGGPVSAEKPSLRPGARSRGPSLLGMASPAQPSAQGGMQTPNTVTSKALASNGINATPKVLGKVGPMTGVPANLPALRSTPGGGAGAGGASTPGVTLQYPPSNNPGMHRTSSQQLSQHQVESMPRTLSQPNMGQAAQMAAGKAEVRAWGWVGGWVACGLVPAMYAAVHLHVLECMIAGVDVGTCVHLLCI